MLMKAVIDYPETDGEPTADNTKQFQWILVLASNLQARFADDPDVFVSGNQFWYPVEGDPGVVAAPDVYAVFGRPKGHRTSYKQWEEDGVPMTVVFEILSPKNTIWEMADKLAFYDDHGVEEYYLYDPDHDVLKPYQRARPALRLLPRAKEYISPRLGVLFDVSDQPMVVRHPDGRPFLLVEELERLRLEAERRAATAETRAATAETALTRLQALLGKVLDGTATPDEIDEARRLRG
ncbi:MAG: Uma2 family endonuclease [Gemmataceae bacterium]